MTDAERALAEDRRQLIEIANRGAETFLELDKAGDPREALLIWLTDLVADAYKIGRRLDEVELVAKERDEARAEVRQLRAELHAATIAETDSEAYREAVRNWQDMAAEVERLRELVRISGYKPSDLHRGRADDWTVNDAKCICSVEQEQLKHHPQCQAEQHKRAR